MRVRGIYVVVIWLLVLLMLPIVGLVVIPAASPAMGAEVADALRAVLGVGPVAQIESISDGLRDTINRYRFSSGTPQPQISWSVASPSPTQEAAPTPAPTMQSSAGTALTPTASPPEAKPGELAPAVNAITADPQIGWQPYGPEPNGLPVMARALLMVDAQRSYAGVALVRIDLSQAQLHMMPGTIEPGHPSGIGRVIPDLGMVPPADQSSLIAAFNGGFKGAHGHFGMMVNGLTIEQPIDGMATVAIYQDGSVRIGAWNQDIVATPDMVAFRQNCPPLIDAGQLNPALDTKASKSWGFTNSSDITWRTGLGITQDGHYLIYAVGNGTDAKFLAEALQEAGAYSAMQLDINQYYAQFVSFSQDSGAPVGQYLLDQMTYHPKEFLVPSVRDFLYLTTR